jgi:Ca2+-binding EF-hand superfamily protein
MALGMKMDELKIRTTDEAGEERFVQDASGASNKAVTMSGFVVYTERPPPCAQLGPAAAAWGRGERGGSLEECFAHVVGEPGSQLPLGGLCDRQFVVNATRDVVLRVRVAENGGKRIRSELEAMAFSWDQQQHEDVLRLAKLFASLRRPKPVMPECLGYAPSKRNELDDGADSSDTHPAAAGAGAGGEMPEQLDLSQWRDLFELVASSPDGATFPSTADGDAGTAPSVDVHGLGICVRAAVGGHVAHDDVARLASAALGSAKARFDLAMFFQVMRHWAAEQPSGVHRKTFAKYDQLTPRAGDGEPDGFIAGSELLQWMQELGDSPTDDEVGLVVRKGESAGDGKVAFDWAVAGLRLLRDRRCYTDLWKRTRKHSSSGWTEAPKANASDLKELNVIGWRLHPRDVMQCRSIAETELSTEQKKAPKKKSGMFGGLFSKSSAELSEEDSFKLDAQQYEEIMAIMREDPLGAAVEGDTDFVETDVELKLSIDLTLSLKGGRHQVVQLRLPAAHLALKTYSATGMEDVPLPPNTVSFQMAAVSVMDCRPAVDPACQYATVLGPLSGVESSQRYLQLDLELNPQQKSYTLKLNVYNQLQIVFVPDLLEDVKRVLTATTPVSEDQLPSQIGSAKAAMGSWSTKQKAAISRQLAERDTWEITAEVAAPVILIPADHSDETVPCLALSLGTLKVNGTSSPPVAGQHGQELKRYSTDEFPLREFRDDVPITENIKISVVDMQAVLASDRRQGSTGPVRDWVAHLASESNTGQLLRRVKFELKLFMGTIQAPGVPSVQRMIIESSLTPFTLAISRVQISELLQIKNGIQPGDEAEDFKLLMAPVEEVAIDEASNFRELAKAKQAADKLARQESVSHMKTEVSRALTFVFEELKILLLKDDGADLALLDIKEMVAAVSSSGVEHNVALFLQSLDISDGGPDEAVKLISSGGIVSSHSEPELEPEPEPEPEPVQLLPGGVDSAEENARSAIRNALVTVTFAQQLEKRTLTMDFKQFTMTFHPALIQNIFQEFVANLGQAAPGVDPKASFEASLRQKFDQLDSDGSGDISHEEVAVLFKELGLELSQDDLEDAIADIDADHSGEVDFEEFSTYMKKLKAGNSAGSSKFTEALRARQEYLFGDAATSDEPSVFTLDLRVTLGGISVQLAKKQARDILYQLHMSRATVSYLKDMDPESRSYCKDRKHAALTLENLTITDMIANNFSELVGVINQHERSIDFRNTVSDLSEIDFEAQDMVELMYDAYGPDDPRRPGFDSLLKVDTCPLKIAVARESLNGLQAYMKEALQAVKIDQARAVEKAHKSAAAAAAAAQTAAADIVTAAKHNVIMVTLKEPTLIVTTDPDPASTSTLRITPAAVQVKIVGDVVTIELVDSLKAFVKADFGGVEMELIHLAVTYDSFQIQKRGDDLVVDSLFNVKGKFWDMRAPVKTASAWTQFLEMSDMRLKAAKGQYGTNVNIDCGARSCMALNVSGSLIYALTQFQNCQKMSAQRAEAALAGESDRTLEGIPPSIGDRVIVPNPTRATIVNCTGQPLHYWVKVGGKSTAQSELADRLIGAQVEVFSRTQQAWVPGKIMKVTAIPQMSMDGCETGTELKAKVKRDDSGVLHELRLDDKSAFRWVCSAPEGLELARSNDVVKHLLDVDSRAHIRARTRSNTEASASLHFCVQGWSDGQVSLTQACTQLNLNSKVIEIYRVDSGDQSGGRPFWCDTANVYADVHVSSGVMIVTLRSSLSIQNETECKLEAALVDGKHPSAAITLPSYDGYIQMEPSDDGWLHTESDCTRHSRGHMPVDIAHIEDLRFRLQGSTEWSPPVLVRADKTGETQRAQHLVRVPSPAQKSVLCCQELHCEHFVVDIVTVGAIRSVRVTRPLQIVNMLPVTVKLMCIREINGKATKQTEEEEYQAAGFWGVRRIPAGEATSTNFSQLRKEDKLRCRMHLVIPHMFPDEVDYRKDIELEVSPKEQEIVFECNRCKLPIKLQFEMQKPGYDMARVLRISCGFWVVNSLAGTQQLHISNSDAWHKSWPGQPGKVDDEHVQAVTMLPNSNRLNICFQGERGLSSTEVFDTEVKNRGNDVVNIQKRVRMLNAASLDTVPSMHERKKLESMWYHLRATVQFGPGQLQNTKILKITPWFVVRNLLPESVRFRARSPDSFVPEQDIPAGKSIEIHPRKLAGCPDEWADGDGHPRIELCGLRSPAMTEFTAQLSRATRSTLVIVDNKSPYTLKRINQSGGPWGDTGKRFREYWNKLGISEGPPELIRPNELVVFGCSSNRKKFGDAEGGFEYAALGSDARINGHSKNPLVDDPSRGKWCHCGSNGKLLHSVKGGRPTQEIHNRIHFEVKECATYATDVLECQLASIVPIAPTPQPGADASLASAFDWSYKLSMEKSGSTSLVLDGVLDGEEVQVVVQQNREAAQFVTTIRPAPATSASGEATTRLQSEISAPPIVVDGEIIVGTTYPPWNQVTVTSEEDLPENPTFEFDVCWPQETLQRLPQNQSGSFQRYLKSIRCDARVTGAREFIVLVMWPKWNAGDSSTELPVHLYSSSYNIKWRATQGKPSILNSLHLNLTLPDIHLTFDKLDHEGSIFNGAIVEHKQLQGTEILNLTLFGVQFGMDCMGKHVTVKAFELVDGQTATTIVANHTCDSLEDHHGNPDFLQLLQNHQMLGVHVQRRVKVNITDDFILKATELAANVARYSGNDRVQKLGLARAPSVMHQLIPGIRACTSLGTVEGDVPAALDGRPGPSSGCMPPVLSSLFAGEEATAQTLFPAAKFGRFEVSLEFRRKTDRGQHMFKTPLGPIPPISSSLQLPALKMDGCNFQDVLGSMATVMKLVTVAQIGEAKRTVKKNMQLKDVHKLGKFGAELMAAHARKRVENIVDGGAGLAYFDKYNFKKQSLNDKTIIANHSTQALYCASSDDMWKEAMHLAFDWNANHQGKVNSKHSAILLIENHSSMPITLQSMEAKVGMSGALSTLVGQAPGCQTSNKELKPMAGGGHWTSAGSSLVFAWGTRMSEVECHVKST